MKKEVVEGKLVSHLPPAYCYTPAGFNAQVEVEAVTVDGLRDAWFAKPNEKSIWKLLDSDYIIIPRKPVQPKEPELPERIEGKPITHDESLINSLIDCMEDVRQRVKKVEASK